MKRWPRESNPSFLKFETKECLFVFIKSRKAKIEEIAEKIAVRVQILILPVVFLFCKE